MTTHNLYVSETPRETWDVPVSGDARFSWEYDEGRERLLALYQKGKDKQWDATTRIDWSLEVDPSNALGLAPESCPIYGSPTYQKLGQQDLDLMYQHLVSWQFSQFLHGEQGAMICSARIVESVPDLDAKFYASTQTMDEARHAETYARFLQEKIQLVYPINPHLQSLLASTLSDSRWDMPYLGMQVLIEGLALAAFGLLRDTTTNPLPKQILSYVMQDEARHVAFGRMALKDAYRELTAAERDEREEFVVEACYLMRDRLRGIEVWETLGFPVEECVEYADQSAFQQMFRSLLFTRIVPIVKDIGLWGEKVQKAYADMGVLDMAGVDLGALMKADEDIAENLDRERAAIDARKAEVDLTIREGASL
jgi:acyl carrier protein phosphodiesterase